MTRPTVPNELKTHEKTGRRYHRPQLLARVPCSELLFLEWEPTSRPAPQDDAETAPLSPVTSTLRCAARRSPAIQEGCLLRRDPGPAPPHPAYPFPQVVCIVYRHDFEGEFHQDLLSCVSTQSPRFSCQLWTVLQPLHYHLIETAAWFHSSY